jgi:transposase
LPSSTRSTDHQNFVPEPPKPGVAIKRTVLTLDNGPIHVSKATRTALAEREHWLTIEWLSKYAPELNDIEEV